ncbi:MAG: DEAD/DEAH box helicase [Promethearchaeota archaeon]
MQDTVKSKNSFDLLHKELRKTIFDHGFVQPTPIQNSAIPKILEGKNLLIIAPTGTGKTEAAVFPIFDKLFRESKTTHLRGLYALYVTPLKALNRDIFRRIIAIGKDLGISIQIRHGDTPQSQRRKQALKPPNILITTPETLQSILPAKRMGAHLKNVVYVIVDEIHELVESKRATQLAVGLERLKERTGKEFQKLLLSATVGSPELVASFLAGIGRPIEIVRTDTEKEFEITIENPLPTTEDRVLAKKLYTSPDVAARINRIAYHIENNSSVLCFTNTRDHAEMLSSHLRLLDPEFNYGIHHGSLAKDVRIQAEQEFKSQELKAIVCTSSLELGIDVGSVDKVIQLMSPRQVSKLIQRVGRAGHKIGAVSRGTIITMDFDDIYESAIIASKALKNELEDILIHENALDVLAHQIAGIVLDKREVTIEEVEQIVKRTFPYANLDKELLNKTIDLMLQLKLIWKNNEILKRSRKTLLFYYERVSTIPDVGQRWQVIDITTNRPIGTLDNEFVATKAKLGTVFIVRGRPWKILNLNENKIEVTPTPDPTGAIPGWAGELIPVPYQVAQEVGDLRYRLERAHRNNENIQEILSEYQLSDSAKEIIINIIAQQIKSGVPIPTHERILIEAFGDYIIIHCCFGSKVNETIGELLSALLTTEMGANVVMRSSPYTIQLQLPSRINPKIIPELLKQNSGHIEHILDLSLSRSSLFLWRFCQVAQRFGIIDKGAEFHATLIERLLRAYRDTTAVTETLREIKLEKLDIPNTKKILSQIINGLKTIDVVQKTSVDFSSPFSLLALRYSKAGSYVKSARPEAVLIEAVKNKILQKRVKLVCMHCGQWESVRQVQYIPDEKEKLRCPKCKNVFLGVVFSRNTTLKKALKHQKAQMKLTREEKKEIERGGRSAVLVEAYGKKAVITLAGRGIGPQTAARILARRYDSEKEFYKALWNAEKEFARTRAFWDER